MFYDGNKTIMKDLNENKNGTFKHQLSLVHIFFSSQNILHSVAQKWNNKIIIYMYM